MYYVKRLSIGIIFLCFITNLIQAQSAIPTSGGEAAGSDGTVSYSVGQLLYTVDSSPSIGSISHGVQQPYEISVIIGIKQIPFSHIDLIAYPNPTTDQLYLVLKYADIGFNDFKQYNLNYQLLDVNGKVIEESLVKNLENEIDLAGLSPATYFLKIISSTKGKISIVKTFKIIKNK